MRDGDQHKDTKATKNPFVSDPVNGYTASEIATLQARLDKQLGPEYVSHRSNGASGKVSYLEAFKVINLANEVFGFNGWNSEVRNVSIDFLDERPDHRYNLGLSVTVRVTLRDGTFHEDIGYGNIENCKGKGAAFEKCKKEGTTDAMKRALRNFGNVLGNCLYDKTFLGHITKLKVPTTKFDPDLLHRRPEFSLPADHPKMQPPMQSRMPVPAMSRRNSTTAIDNVPSMRQDSLRSEADNYGDDIFDELDFDEDRPGNYDEVAVDESMVESSEFLVNPNHGSTVVGPNLSNLTTDTYVPPNEFMKSKVNAAPVAHTGARQMTMTQSEAKRLHALRLAEKEKSTTSNAPAVEAVQMEAINGPPPSNGMAMSRPPPPVFQGEPIHPAIDGAADPPPNYQPSFMNSRTLVQPSSQAVLFDPKITSPSIPKSGLADLSKSTPIKRPGTSTTQNESPLATGSPLRRMGSALNGLQQGFNTRSGVSQFRAPSKLNQATAAPDALQTAKRGSEALVEHPAGSISMNERVGATGGGSAEKKLKN